MATRAINPPKPPATANLQSYEKLLRDLFIFPFLLFLLFSVAVTLMFDLYRAVTVQIAHAHTINSLIAQTASAQNPQLTAKQVTLSLSESPYIDSIVFNSMDSPLVAANTSLTWRTYVSQSYMGISQPVYLPLPQPDIATTGNAPNVINSNQLIGYLHLTLNLDKIRRAWLWQNLPLLGLIGLLSTTLLVGSLRQVRPFFRRLNHLEQLSEQVINNKSDKFVLPINPEEKNWVFSAALSHLVDKQQHLINQIKQLLKKNRQLIEKQENYVYQNSNFQNVITHELKLSLNQVYAGLQLLNSQYVTQEQKDAIGIIERGTHKLDDKLNQIIQISRLEKGQIGITVEKFNPAQLISALVENFQPIARDKGLPLYAYSHHPHYILEGDVQKINLILTSLVENALKFTDKGQITLSSQIFHLPKQLRWQIAVNDTGVGIAESYLGSIFEPFFQIDPNHISNFKDTGVGLYVVKQMVLLLNGEIQVESDIKKGTTFTVSFLLNDWQDTLQYAALKHKTIAILDEHSSTNAVSNEASGYAALYSELASAGAIITQAADPAALLTIITTTAELNNGRTSELDDADAIKKAATTHAPLTPDTRLAAIIFMPQTLVKTACDISQTVRQQQLHSRTLIIYYYDMTQNVDTELLLASGVDFIEVIDISQTNAIQGIMKNLIQYLQ